MRVEYASGKVETIGTDTSWKWADGPLVSSNVYQGDEYDATREIDGWCEASFDDSSWNDAVKRRRCHSREDGRAGDTSDEGFRSSEGLRHVAVFKGRKCLDL